MKKLTKYFAIAACVAAIASCKKAQEPLPPYVPPTPQDYPEPGTPAAKVAAHRGGASEGKVPDNSIAALRYAMSFKCYASECDIYWTKDDDIVVAHADGNCQINGLYPWEATAAEIRAAGSLSNGELIPTLSEYLDVAMEEGSCTKLWLDIKLTSKAGKTVTTYSINAAKRACEIIAAKKAKHFAEMICTGNSTVWKSALVYANQSEVPIAWMSGTGPANHKKYASSWANMSAASYMYPHKTTGFTVQEYVDAGMQISVFNVDQYSGDSNAVYSEKDVQYFIDNYDKMKVICTNYPKWLIEKLK